MKEWLQRVAKAQAQLFARGPEFDAEYTPRGAYHWRGRINGRAVTCPVPTEADAIAAAKAVFENRKSRGWQHHTGEYA